MSRLQQAASYQSRIDADVALLTLGNEGIDAFQFDAEINSAYGGLFIPVRLMVPTEDLSSALEILAEAGLL